MRAKLPPSASAGGFTLVELAIVVLVVSLLLGSLLVPLNLQVQQRNSAETRRILEETREALIGYAMANGRLPRPAVSDTDGSEKGACADHAACTGYIPWAVLGTPRIDAYGKLIRYSVTPALANAPITISSTGGKRIRTRTPSTTPILADAVPAVLISHGLYNYGRTADGDNIVNTSTTNVDEQANATNDGQSANPFWSRPQSATTTAPGGEFDDIVVWVPQSLLVGRMVAAGRLP